MPAHFLVFVKKIHVCLQFKIPTMFYLLRKAHLLQLSIGVMTLLACGVMIFLKPLDVNLFNNSLPCACALSQWLVAHPVGTQFFALTLLLLQATLLLGYVRMSGFLDEENVLSILAFTLVLVVSKTT